MFAYRLFFIFNLIQGMSLCNIRMCLAWSVDEKILTFTCKVNQLHFKVEFANQYHETQGYCLHPFPAPYCYTYYKNSTITQNTYTNETSLIVKGVINNNINGQWSCHHGTNIDVAFVNVTVFSSKETKYPVAAYGCLLWTNIPFIITIIFSREILWMMEYKQERRRFAVWFVAFCSFTFITKFCNENYFSYVLLFVKFVLMIACGILLIIVPLLNGTIDKKAAVQNRLIMYSFHVGLPYLSLRFFHRTCAVFVEFLTRNVMVKAIAYDKAVRFFKVVLSMIGILTGVIMILLLLSKGKYSQHTNRTTEQAIERNEEMEGIL